MTSLPADPTKAELRAWLKVRRRTRDPAWLRAVAEAVALRLRELPELRAPRTVGAYLSVRAELPSGPLLDALAGLGHRLAVPAVLDGGRMEFRALGPDRVPGPLGIPTSTGPAVDPEVLVIPGLAWDVAGHRLGHGGGYYDRFLAAHPVATLGVGPEDEVLPWIPNLDHDRGVACLVTEARTVRIRPPVRVGAAAWIRDGRLFAARRSATMSRPGAWELPGGKIEPTESDADGLARELREELGITARVTGLLGHAVHAYDDVTVHLVAQWVACDEAPRPTEHDAVAWLSADALDSVAWAPADVPFLPALAAALRQKRTDSGRTGT